MQVMVKVQHCNQEATLPLLVVEGTGQIGFMQLNWIGEIFKEKSRVSTEADRHSIHLKGSNRERLGMIRKWQEQNPLIFEVSKLTKKPPRRFLIFS